MLVGSQLGRFFLRFRFLDAANHLLLGIRLSKSDSDLLLTIRSRKFLGVLDALLLFNHALLDRNTLSNDFLNFLLLNLNHFLSFDGLEFRDALALDLFQHALTLDTRSNSTPSVRSLLRRATMT